jgi:alkylhydroperoxidase family enzyme
VFFGGRVDQRYKQLARLKLSVLHGCRTCNKQNVPGALAAGFTGVQIDALVGGDHAPFTEAERAVIDYASQVALTNMDGEMTPELFRRLRAHFSEADILELGTTMAVISGMAKLSFVLNVVEKEAYCPFAPAGASQAA